MKIIRQCSSKFKFRKEFIKRESTRSSQFLYFLFFGVNRATRRARLRCNIYVPTYMCTYSKHVHIKINIVHVKKICCLFINWIAEHGIDEQNFIVSKKKKREQKIRTLNDNISKNAWSSSSFFEHACHERESSPR